MTDDRPLLTTEIARRENLHPNTVKRWIKEGVLGPDHTRVLLAYSMRGVKYAVKPSDLKKFYEESQIKK